MPETVKRILVIEDDENFLLFLKKSLSTLKHEIVTRNTFDTAVRTIEKEFFDLVLVDLNLPDGNGFDLCTLIRSKPEMNDIPILFISGNEQLASKVTAFSVGADDYIIKPIHPIELKARIEAKLRKISKHEGSGSFSRFGLLCLDWSAQKCFVTRNSIDKEIKLTATEFRLLSFFVKNEGQALSREQILGAVWGGDLNVTDRAVDLQIFSLRRKIPELVEMIETIPSHGYRFTSGKK